MGDSESRDSVLAQFDCTEDGGATESVGPKYAEIIVIRHGETEWNADRRIQVADRLSREPRISAVYSSDLRRAFDTAEIIAKRCGVLEVTKDPGLRERHLGDLQGLVLRDAAKVNPVAHKAFVSKRDDIEIPGGGESFKQLCERCTLALDRIAKKHRGERVVVVSHGGTIRAFHKRASPHDRSFKRILNTAISVFHVSDKDEWSIKSWNDVSHLSPTGFLGSGFGGDENSG
ncbi:hypothetical protein ACS0TY_001233 [Phlomoides rotata]